MCSLVARLFLVVVLLFGAVGLVATTPARAQVPPPDPSSAVIQITSISVPNVLKIGYVQATIRNRSNRTWDVRAFVEITGDCRLLSPAAQIVTIPAGGSVTVSWKVEALREGKYYANFAADAVK